MEIPDGSAILFRSLINRRMSKGIEPLSSLLRPRNFDEFAGQKHLIGDGAPIRKILES